MRWARFVAVGDSYTEGLDDPYEDGSYRGWADLVATQLEAEAGPAFRYANLAVRGRVFPAVVAEQVPAALEMRPDLISFAAGGNDMLRPNVPHAMLDRFGEVVAQLWATGADVVLLRFPRGCPVSSASGGSRPAWRPSTRSSPRLPTGLARCWSTSLPTTSSSTRYCGAPTGFTCRPLAIAGRRRTCWMSSASSATPNGCRRRAGRSRRRGSRRVPLTFDGLDSTSRRGSSDG